MTNANKYKEKLHSINKKGFLLVKVYEVALHNCLKIKIESNQTSKFNYQFFRKQNKLNTTIALELTKHRMGENAEQHVFFYKETANEEKKDGSKNSKETEECE